MNRLQVVLISSLVSKSAAAVRMVEDVLKAVSLVDEEEEGSGSYVLSVVLTM